MPNTNCFGIVVSEHAYEDRHRRVFQQGLEGIVSKQLSALYVPGPSGTPHRDRSALEGAQILDAVPVTNSRQTVHRKACPNFAL
jgi:hypothetical protein